MFSQTLFAVSVLTVAVGELIVSLLVATGRKLSALTVTQAAIALAVGVSIALTGGEFDHFALIVTLWAAATALSEVWFSWKAPQRSPALEIRVIGVFAGLLAILLIVVPSTPTSVIGLYGGYCFVVGVYLAIAAFDRAPERATESEA